MKLYYHDPHEELAEDVTVFVVLLGLFVGAWWACLHFLDWLTLDIIPWWLELLLAIPSLIGLGTALVYGRNPLHWWPMVWGTRVAIPMDLWYAVQFDNGQIMKRYGGPLNVYVSRDFVKFRRRRDAVTFCLVNL